MLRPGGFRIRLPPPPAETAELSPPYASVHPLSSSTAPLRGRYAPLPVSPFLPIRLLLPRVVNSRQTCANVRPYPFFDFLI